MQALDFPNNIQIETTSRCNAKCEFCPYPESSRTQPQGVMDEALFESILDQLAGHPIELVQPFLNNDPLMDKRIVPRLRRILDALPGVRVSITTNGTLLRDEVCEALAHLPLDTIHVSSHALTPAAYRQIMGIDGFTVIRNVNRLWDAMRRAGSTTRLVVTAVLVRENREEVAHLQAYWEARGIAFFLNPLNHRSGNIPRERFVRMLPLRADTSRSQLRSYGMSGCPALYSFMGILWNGDVITCCMDWHRARVLGNARTESLHDIWHGRGYRRLRDLSDAGRLHEAELCGECGEDRFSVDTRVLRTLLDAQHDADAGDRGVLALLESLERRPEALQLGLVREWSAR